MFKYKYIYLILIIVFGFFCFSLISKADLSDRNRNYKLSFESSLHHTTDGMKYWYSKENGGIESISNIPYDDLTCKNCHAASCDDCHQKEEFIEYTAENACEQDGCLKCHGREASIIKIDNAEGTLDVHFGAGMECMDCHTSNEIHGKDKKHNSMKDPSFFEIKCLSCHKEKKESKSHIIHKGKLDCQACHNRQVVSCTNCHMDTLVKSGKKVSIPQSGWIFLMNYNGKITSANTQTYVVDNDKTFLMFAPQHSHSIMPKGRKCEECHANDIVEKIINKQYLKLTWIEDGKVKNLKGVIPVLSNIEYDFAYQNYKDGKWTLIEKPKQPKIHYVGNGSPLTDKQLNKLNAVQKN